MTIGYTHGRFQPLHNGHFGVFEQILERCDQLWIGIANPLRQLPENIDTYPDELRESVMKARAPDNNPYSYIERQEMIVESLESAGVDLRRIRTLPHFGAYECTSWRELFPPKEDTVIILPAKDTHHYSKIEIYKAEGWKVEIVPQILGISGKIFDMAWPDGNWQELVPEGTRRVLEDKLKQL
ncbi:MAG: adenylyltransferase/cytidyltransferase family protein [Candidatus Woesearchaeota archaeon]